MGATAAVHPTDQALQAYGHGKLDDASAESVYKHLDDCTICQRRVAEMSPDSFLGRLRNVQEPPEMSATDPPEPDASFTDRTPAMAISPPPAETMPPGLANHPDYEIMRELGRGGMGVVYLAHNRLMERDEVLKVMNRHILERPGVLDRFLREIRAVAQLRHPNIVTAYHATRLGDSIVFAMEYVDGLDLSRMVKAKGPLPVAHACYFAYQAALGLQHAHEEGLVHRDIKPGNLMLSRKKDKSTVKVLDFGLAKVTREEKADVQLTSHGQALGTPDYIAPEQIIDAPSADIRADIYSLGGTLYHLLIGHPPFQTSSLYDMFQAHMSRDADPLNLIRPEVPVELAALVAKMMAKDPRRRFQRPGEVAEAITPFFKRTSTAFRGSKPEISQDGQRNVRRPVNTAVSVPTQPATSSSRPDSRVKRVAEPNVPEARWDSLIELRGKESAKGMAPATVPARRPPWASWPMMIAASLFGLITLGVIIITIKTQKSEFKITVLDDKRSNVEADGVVIDHNPSRGAPAASGTEGMGQPVGESQSSMMGMAGAERPTDQSPTGMMGGGVMGGMMGGMMSQKPDDPSPRTKATLAKLDRPVAMNFGKKTPLRDVLKYVREATESPNDPGIPIYVDVVGIEDAEKTLNSRVMIDLKNAPLKGSLDLLLKQVGLEYCVKDGLLFISTPAGVASEKDTSEAAASDDAPRSLAIAARLEEPVAMRFRSKTPLQEVLDVIKSRSKGSKDTSVQIYVDPTVYTMATDNRMGPAHSAKTASKTGTTRPLLVTMDLKGVPLRTTLRHLLAQVGLGFSLRKGILIVNKKDGMRGSGGMMGGMGMMGSGMAGRMGQKPDEGRGMMSGMGMMGGGMASMMGEKPDHPSPSTKATVAKLDRPVAMNFGKKTPLREVLKYVREATGSPNDPGIPIYLDLVGVEDAEAVLNSAITIDLNDIPLNDTLELLLEQAGLAHCVKDGLLFVSTPWRVSIEKSVPEAATADDTPESRAIVEKLDKLVPMRFPNKTPLRDVLQYIDVSTKGQTATTIPVYFDPPDSAEIEKANALTVRMELKGVPLRTTLRLLLAQVGMEFSVKNGILIINKPTGMGGMMGSMMRGMQEMGGNNPARGAEDTVKKSKESAKISKKAGLRGGT